LSARQDTLLVGRGVEILEYKRDIDELQKNAVTWWPAELSRSQGETSIIPKLLASRGKFVALLKLSGNAADDIFEIASQANFPGNLLVKHFAVLTDVGGEGLKRIGSDFPNLFPFDESRNQFYMDFVWRGSNQRYHFTSLPLRSGKLDNPKLGIDGSGLSTEQPLSDLHRDTIMLLMHGAANIDAGVAEKSDFYKCVLGGLLGVEGEIDRYVEERYIWVSKITGGATANELGQIAQTWVYDLLAEKLGPSFKVAKNGKLVLDGEGVTSDVMVTTSKGSVGVEVSFQVTTNSTIERKGNEAENRQKLMHKHGHYAAYIVDGAGNFERRSAVTKICNSSDCTVAFSESEIIRLVSFIQERIG
jgi:hypothetical protein